MEKLLENSVYILLAWLIIMSVVLFFMMGDDKKRAKSAARRIPEARLFFFALVGGAIGGTVGMRFFRHKTKHWYFALGFPLLAAVQIALCVLLAVK